MATTLKVLGQSQPAAATPTDLYTVPANTSTVVSTITICNTDGQTDTISVQVRVGGALSDPKQYIYASVPLAANDTLAGTFGISLAQGDVVTVTSASGKSSFSLFGQENT